MTAEAESGALSGSARVRRLAPGDAVPTGATLESEASGYGLVELKSTGAAVTITNGSGKQANTLVVRASIPDAPTGGGLSASLNLYVDGVYRQAITLSSTQAWNYRNASTNLDDPNAGGSPYHFYNDFPVWVTGNPVPTGSTITLRKDTANTAAAYDIDSIDLEDVGPARIQPPNSLSVISYGADPTFAKDSTAAIQETVNAARTQRMSVWIPPGKYMTNSLTSTTLNMTGVQVEGAGMWHTTLYRKVPLPAPAGWQSQILVGSNTTLSDLQMDGDAIWRGTGGGADYGVQSMGALGWHVARIWTRHTDANWLSGSNGLMEDSRTSDSYGDGFNINNSNTPNTDKRGNDITVRNCFARGTGDDSFATYSDAGPSGTNDQIDGAKILNNTAVAPWWANGIRIAGGQNVQVMNNLVNSVSSNSALDIGVFGDTGRPLESATISENVLIGGGGWNGVRHGVRISSPSSTSLFPNASTNVTMTQNVLRGSLRAGLYIDRTHVNATLATNTIDGPASQGIWVTSGVTGTGTFTDNVIEKLRSGAAPFTNDSNGFTAKMNSNSWQSGLPYAGTGAAVPGTVQAENYNTGGQGTAYNVTSVNGNGTAYRSDGVDLESASDTGGGYDLGWTASTQWFRYTVDVASAGTYTLSLRVAAPAAVTGALHLSDGSGTNLSGAVSIPSTGGWQTWKSVAAKVTLPAGRQVLTLNQDQGNWNINSFTFA
ncbi:carbohydrate-binding protein [Streptomyces sp. NPDC051362]|uniref:carbohydrate-binding protein n=1 Tax=Streptomyces sp. NPDC051362 TaxID=3365651 RepID=UPI0037970543